jgi:hypothetical protein
MLQDLTFAEVCSIKLVPAVSRSMIAVATRFIWGTRITCPSSVHTFHFLIGRVLLHHGLNPVLIGCSNALIGRNIILAPGDVGLNLVRLFLFFDLASLVGFGGVSFRCLCSWLGCFCWSVYSLLTALDLALICYAASMLSNPPAFELKPMRCNYGIDLAWSVNEVRMD